MGAWQSWDAAGSSVLSEDSPGFLRMYIRYHRLLDLTYSELTVIFGERLSIL